MNKFSVAKTYNRIAQTYIEKYGDSPFLLERTDKFSTMLPRRGKVLDLGCGSGRVSRHLALKGFQTIGIDVSEEMLKRARKTAPGCDFRRMDMRALKFPKEHFDGIWSSLSLIHIPKREMKTTLEGCRRVLKTGGIMFLSTICGNEEEQFRYDWLKKKELLFTYYMSEEGLVKHLRSARFLTEEIGRVTEFGVNDNFQILYAYARK